jgi:hypothetical protein
LTEKQFILCRDLHVREFTPEQIPVWIWHGDELLHGFPVSNEVAVKLARNLRAA